jgi:short-subunit dehydrogenase
MTQTVLVTGAASGIGRATALAYAHRGARLALVDRDAIGLEAAARDCRLTAAEVATFVVDLADAGAITDLARDVLARFTAIDVLVNNAGVAVAKPFERTTAADWRWVFDINVWAPIRLTQALLPSMTARRRGHVVMIASLAGLVGVPGMSAYATSKHALLGFTESLRAELAPHGIATTVVCPGFVRTGLHRATRYEASPIEHLLDRMPDWYGVTAERAARMIVDAVARREPRLVFGVEKIAWYLQRLSPRVFSALLELAGQRIRRPSAPTTTTPAAPEPHVVARAAVTR